MIGIGIAIVIVIPISSQAEWLWGRGDAMRDSLLHPSLLILRVDLPNRPGKRGLPADDRDIWGGPI